MNVDRHQAGQRIDAGDGPPEYLLTSAAAAQAGVSVATLRAYEASGLVRPLRTAHGVRLFTQADVEKVKQIYRARLERHGKTGARREQP
jgi:hypothetical protein